MADQGALLVQCLKVQAAASQAVDLARAEFVEGTAGRVEVVVKIVRVYRMVGDKWKRDDSGGMLAFHVRGWVYSWLEESVALPGAYCLRLVSGGKDCLVHVNDLREIELVERRVDAPAGAAD